MRGNTLIKYGPGMMRPKYGVGDLTEVMIKYGFGLEPGPDILKPKPEKEKYYVLPEKKISSFWLLREAQKAAIKIKSGNYAIIEDDDPHHVNYFLVKNYKFKGHESLEEARAVLRKRKSPARLIRGKIVDASVLNALSRMDLKKEMGIK